MRRVLTTIVEIDVPLVLAVAVASYALARAAIAPLEAARDRERQFAADAAHGLRSPLTAIVAVAQAARSRAGDAERADFDTITANALEASDAIADLLTLARHPVARCCNENRWTWRRSSSRSRANSPPVAASRDIALDRGCAGSAIVDGDERRLREMARNLLDNAIRHARCTREMARRATAAAASSSSKTTARAFRSAIVSASSSGITAVATMEPARVWGWRSFIGWRAPTAARSSPVTASQGGARFVASMPARDV